MQNICNSEKQSEPHRPRRYRVLPKAGSSFKIFLIVLLLGVLVFSIKPILKSLSGRDFSFLTAAGADKFSSQELFAEPVKNFLRESPEMTFVQENSIVGVCPPATITPQVLGSVVEDVESDSGGDITEYVVEPGDNLSSIATKFNISLNTILWANDLNNNSLIKPGQKLIILPVSGILYTVRKNDTLSTVAKTYKADLKEIIAFNGFSEQGDIFVGDLLIIPGGQMPSKVSHIALTPVAASYFIFPCEGKISQGLHYYNAIDVANKCGGLVVATSSGTVQRAGWVRIGGKRVTILHSNGVVTYYGHLSTILVSPGQRVDAGDIIGYIGNTGYTLGATGCHLHFAVIGAKNFLAKYPVGSYINWGN